MKSSMRFDLVDLCLFLMVVEGGEHHAWRRAGRHGVGLGKRTNSPDGGQPRRTAPGAGFVTLTDDGRMVLRDWPVSGRCDGTLPLPGCFGPEPSQRGSRNEVALNIKCIVDGSMDAEKALSGSC